jgi:hypothetical protein
MCHTQIPHAFGLAPRTAAKTMTIFYFVCLFFSTREEDLDECVKQAAKQQTKLSEGVGVGGQLAVPCGTWVSAGVGVRTHALDTAREDEHDRINL